jgi:hypothetical protein
MEAGFGAGDTLILNRDSGVGMAVRYMLPRASW